VCSRPGSRVVPKEQHDCVLRVLFKQGWRLARAVARALGLYLWVARDISCLSSACVQVIVIHWQCARIRHLSGLSVVVDRSWLFCAHALACRYVLALRDLVRVFIVVPSGCGLLLSARCARMRGTFQVHACARVCWRSCWRWLSQRTVPCTRHNPI
jgi:hypothetical protein